MIADELCARHRAPALLAVVLAALAGCGAQPEPPLIPIPAPASPLVEVQGVRQAYAVLRSGPSPAEAQRLTAELRDFVGSRMDALHMVLPPGPAMDRFAAQLVLDGVIPRKIRRDPRLARAGYRGGAEIVAERYVATVAPCPALDLAGAAFGPNPTRPGFGCADVADFAAQTSDPADLLGSGASPPSDAARAAAPVALWRGFQESGASGATGGGGGGSGVTGGVGGSGAATTGGAASGTSSAPTQAPGS
jgi:pilus biogenesis lipoprotein CpaD